MPHEHAQLVHPLQRTLTRLVGMSMTATFLLAFTLIFPPKLFAQGTFQCVWSPPFPPGHCGADSSLNCDPGFSANPNVCNTWKSKTECDNNPGPFTCVAGPVPTLIPTPIPPGTDCAAEGGECKPTCGSGEVDIGKLNCTPAVGGQPRTCCQPSSGNVFTPDECELDIPNAPPGEPGIPGLKTALGCIPDNPIEFVAWMQRSLLGIGGGIALLLMGVGAGYILVSRGNPEQIKHGKEVFTGAAIGLALMIFAIFLLQLIGVDILGVFRR